MIWQFSPLVPLMLGSAVVLLAVAAVTLHWRSSPGSTALAAVNIGGVIWAASAAFQLASATFQDAATFHKISFLGMDTIGVALFAFGAAYSKHANWITPRKLIAVSLPFAVTQALVWTSGHQTLMWKALSFDTTGSLAILRENPGIWWWVDTAYTYLLIGVAIFLMIVLFIREPGVYRRQVSALLAALLVPLAADIVYANTLQTSDAINVSPALFTWVGLALYWGFTRYGLLEVAPTVRDYIVGHMSDSVIVTDTRDRAVYLNPAAEKLIGRELRTSVGRPIFEVMAGCPGLRAAHLMIEDDEVESLREYEHSGRFYEGRVSVFRNRSNRVRGSILVFRDTTDRKKAELALKEARRDLEDRVQAATGDLRAANVELFESRTRLAHLLSSSPAVIYCREPHEPFPFTFVGDNLGSQLGFKAKDILGDARFWAERLHPEDQHLLVGVGEVVSKGEASYEYRLLSNDGTYRWIHDRIRLVRDSKGRPTELIGSWLDVTDRRQMEEQVRQSSKMEAVGVLAGGIAHDFNNLLTAMGGYAELIAARAEEGDPTQRDIAEISRAVGRAADLTRQLLAFSRKQVLKPRIVSLNDVVRSTEKMFARLVGEDIEFRTDLAPDLGLVRADSGQMEQICMNLIVNARDAMPDGGHLILGTKNLDLAEPGAGAFAGVPPGSYVVLSVTDTGCGIEEDVLPHVFEPFFTTKANGGTGLGLSTVYGIAGQSGGRVTVQSRVGEGTTFHVLLPRLQGEIDEQPSTEPIPAERLSGSETILVVEDEPAVRALIATALSSHGFTVVEADGADRALELVGKDGPPDLLVTDVVMRATSGPDLAKQLHETHPDLRVLYISGYARDKLNGVLNVKDVRFLEKPFTIERLITAVRAALSEK